MYHLSKRFTVPFLVLGLLLAASLACGSGTVSPTAEQAQAPTTTVSEATESLESTNTPEPTPVPPTPTPQPIGMNRGNPFPRSEVVSAPNWDTQVLEVVRGDEAWQAIQAANQFNEPAPEGMEYLLVKLHVKSTYADSDEHSISGSDFKVTGDRLIEYFTASVVEPDPQLDAQLFAGGETEGWSSYLIGQGESNLILIVDELLSFDENRLRFIALDDGASISVAPELSDIEPTDLGKERGSPAPFGEAVTTEDWQVTLLEVVRGDEAWTMVQEANRFNDPPEEGMEYIAVKVHVRYISTVDESAQMDGSYFKTTGSASVLYDWPSVVEPSPELSITLFPGGEYEGWVILQAAQDETDLIAVFEPLLDFSGKNKRFLSLEP